MCYVKSSQIDCCILCATGRRLCRVVKALEEKPRERIRERERRREKEGITHWRERDGGLTMNGWRSRRRGKRGYCLARSFAGASIDAFTRAFMNELPYSGWRILPAWHCSPTLRLRARVRTCTAWKATSRKFIHYKIRRSNY